VLVGHPVTALVGYYGAADVVEGANPIVTQEKHSNPSDNDPLGFVKEWGIPGLGAVGGAAAIGTLPLPLNAIIGGLLLLAAVSRTAYLLERRRPQELRKRLEEMEQRLNEAGRLALAEQGRAEAAERALTTFKERLYEVTKRGAQLAGVPYEEDYLWVLTVGETDAADRLYERYTTRVITGKTVQYRNIGTKSNTAFRAAGKQVGFHDLGAEVTPADRVSLLDLLKRNSPDHIEGLVVFEPEIGDGDKHGLTWSVEYHDPGAFSDLRVHGEDTLTLYVGHETKTATVNFTFPPDAKECACTVVGPIGLPVPATTRDATRGANCWTWTVGSQPPNVTGVRAYKFTLRMRPKPPSTT
jgi:hypothetical protein